VRIRLLASSVIASAVFAAAASAGTPGFEVSFQGQSHAARPGTAWAFYIRATQGGRPWKGAVTLTVQTAKGKTVDDVGRFAFNGTLLQGYLWNTRDHGAFVFRATFTAGGRTVGQTVYPIKLG
jgi:hypothetical protein